VFEKCILESKLPTQP